jgi:hypothetical protein
MRCWRWVGAVAVVSACGLHPTSRAVTSVGLAGDGRVLVTTTAEQGGDIEEDRWIVDAAGSHFGYAPKGQATPPTLAQQCVAAVCYRVVPGRLAVEQSGDTGRAWGVAWQRADPSPGVAAISLVVRGVPGEHEVFVANGRDGLLYRDVGGDWHRLGYPAGGEGLYYESAPPLSSDPMSPWPPVAAAAAVLGAVIAFTISALVRGRPRRRRILQVAAVTAIGAAVAYAGAGLPDVGMFPGLLYGLPVIAAAILATTAFAARPST